MQIFKNRPLALFCCAISLTAVLALRLNTIVKASLAISVLIAAMLLFSLLRLLPKMKKLLLYGVFTLMGCGLALLSSYLFFDLYFAQTQKDVDSSFVIEGVVVERNSSTSFSSSFEVALLSLAGEENHETVILECEYPSPMQCGDYISISVTQRAFQSLDGYNEESAVLSEGCTRILVSRDAQDCVILDEKCDALRIKLIEWNHRLSSGLKNRIGGEEGALSVALLLGNRSYLSEDTVLQFRRSGISHLLALSGMHVSVIAGFLELLLRRLRMSKTLRAILIPCALFAYLLLTGASASTVRAVVMIGFLYLAFLLGADYDSMTAVCIVPAAFLLITPYAVYDLSLWMSFLAALSIIVFYPLLRTVGAKIRGIERPAPLGRRGCAVLFEAIGTGVAANASLMLLSATLFAELSIASVPTTILLSFPMSLLLICSIPALLFSQLVFLALPCRFLSQLMLFCAGKVSSLPNVLVSMNSEAEKWMLILFTALLILLAVLKINRQGLFLLVPAAMLATVLLSVCMTLQMPFRTMEASEENGGFLQCSEGGQTVVYDYSEGFGTNVALLAEQCNSVRCTEIGDLVITKYDNRRPYLLASLSSSVLVRRVRLPQPKNAREEALAARIAQEAELHGITVLYHMDGLCVEP